ncbi:Bifunctional protein RIB2 [Golovinomyces cichoracearum]|uniref:Bifunctional protein RIB2 n=1 Tax=Golovinomyces cichoracearum TaxID=62708 RepID=A0A420HFA8_9PEZI|nr:Bifunctional protein RIB2 [Golovinomyces cichoracearum]
MGETPSPISHANYMHKALELARKSPPKPSNFRVGALLVDTDADKILSTGFTLECTGNTHAEQCCLAKLATDFKVSEEDLVNILPKNTVLYTTVEPCSLRLSGAVSCVDRILKLKDKIKTVYVGLMEPNIFVSENNGKNQLEAAGIKVCSITGLETEILEAATAGHH